MAETDEHAAAGPRTPVAAAPARGEPCEQCGAPLTSDQRYCLECGRRRGGPRIDYRHYMAPGDPAAAEPAAQPAEAEQTPGSEEPGKRQRDYAPLAAVGGIAVLGLMLLVGVLIGKGNESQTTSTPPVITVPATEGAGESSESSGSAKKDTGGGAPGGASAKKAKKGGSGGGGGTGNAKTATDSELESLNAESGESYSKKSEELPNEIATPGAPPPIDKSKPPGGGEGGGEVIK